MHPSLILNRSISLLLSAAIVSWPCHCTSIEPYDCKPISLEELGLESLGLDKAYKKILQPVKDLKPSDGREKMAKTTLKFMNDLNALTGYKLCVDDGVAHAANMFHHYGKPQTEKQVAGFRNLLKNQKKLGLDDEDCQYDLKKKKEFGNIDDMTDNEIWSWVCVFAGCLMVILPFPLVQSLGSGMIATGIYGVGMYGNEEKEDKKK